jgi:hypothetical protein
VLSVPLGDFRLFFWSLSCLSLLVTSDFWSLCCLSLLVTSDFMSVRPRKYIVNR